MPPLVVWLALIASVTAAATWVARQYALRGNLMDQPGDRRSHHVATPRGGGIAIVLVVLVVGCYLMSRDLSGRALWIGFLPGLLIVAGIGWWDDHRPLSPWLRLVVQAVAALMLAAGAGWQSGHWLPALLAFGAAMVLVNVWNFMDGINGLATTQAGLAAVAYAGLLAGEWRWLALALLAGCLGFLPFNFPKARIFLGDVGSGALGFMLAGLVTAASIAVPPGSVPLLMLPLSIFLVDAGFTLLRRILRREPWWTPHVTHLYQIAARRLGHGPVTLAYAASSGVTLSLMLVWPRSTWGQSVSVAVTVYLVVSFVWFASRRGLRE
ncbi:MraY family glycosyltransferase [Pseudoxanthomonas japonensis]|uniref:Lipopolysaccharide biosynthesis protein n=1 Tax=Pseudoxanthomonas japonensis TaxID=69284 RepID=A0ABQ6ZGI8_9GAMM|nr:glycosyltransferase family 4 protein [Pseudoxanthomonas japonensis]KAF1724845.1 lipopolysaccharide biosynthesis protein [Pseudoxanthomonas japonensis]